MTAEISIMNNKGIVLAADSAVTMTIGNSQKPYNTANKLFTLGSKHSIAVMVYGNAEFMGVPWEIIIKEFRKEVRLEALPTLNDYANCFIQFVATRSYLNNDELSNIYIHNLITNTLNVVLSESQEKVNRILGEKYNIKSNEITTTINETIVAILANIMGHRVILDNYDQSSFILKYQDLITQILKANIFEEINDELIGNFIELVYRNVVVKNDFIVTSGIVFGGYGSDEIFPSNICYEFDFMIDQKIKFIKKEENKIDAIRSTSSISAFAQGDMIWTILKGIDPLIEGLINQLIGNIQGISMPEKQAIVTQIADIQRANFINPILSTVSGLNVDELGNMADTLVSLTSFKRHITDSIETVGGPVDVLAITKGDGPIWLKRKKYFDIADNLDFQIRKESDL